MLSETGSQRYLNRGCEPSPDECAGDYFSSLLDSIYSRLMARINDPRDGAWANISNADLVHMWFESLNRARAYGSRVQDESIPSRFHDLYLLMVAWILVLGESPDVKTALSKDVREALDPLIDAVGEKVRGTNA